MALGALRALAGTTSASDGWMTLMYHELAVSGRSLAKDDPGYELYCVDRDAFREHVDAIAGAGLRLASLTEARARGEARTVALTFDDGCETDLLEVAPILRDRGFGATFFVVGDFVGCRGYMNAVQLRALAAAGFEIGSHSMTHRILTTLGPAELDRELAGSRARLQDATGLAVEHFSCPHGRWSPAVAASALRAGYETISTSQAGLNTRHTPATELRRFAVQRGVSPATVAEIARGRGLWRPIVRSVALDAGKRLIGEAGYAALRDAAMRLRLRR